MLLVNYLEYHLTLMFRDRQNWLDHTIKFIYFHTQMGHQIQISSWMLEKGKMREKNLNFLKVNLIHCLMPRRHAHRIKRLSLSIDNMYNVVGQMRGSPSHYSLKNRWSTTSSGHEGAFVAPKRFLNPLPKCHTQILILNC